MSLNYRYIKIEKNALGLLIKNIKDFFVLIGPAIEDDVVVLREIDFCHLPCGFRDSQAPGYYRLLGKRDENIFSFGNGPDSFKRFLHPPVIEMFSFKQTKKGLVIKSTSDKSNLLAFFGTRACDINALNILKKVFCGYDTQGVFRDDVFIIGVNCLYPSENCFCSSLGTGPEIKSGCDIIITEIERYLLIEATERGLTMFSGIDYEMPSEHELLEKDSIVEGCKTSIQKFINSKDLSERLYRNPEHSRWSKVAERCLACGNCTQVCPTCFCNSTYDSVDISNLRRTTDGLNGRRIRVWDSCFSLNFARVYGGNFRPSRRARYRHWLSHKFGYWIDQFNEIGCVGCGRCITWCPVGIDVTEELESLEHR